MPREHLFRSAPLLLSELLSLLRLVLEVDLSLDDVRLPTFGGALDGFGRGRSRRRGIECRREVAEAFLEGRQAAVAPGGRSLDDYVTYPENGSASLALEAHASIGQ